MNHRILPLSLAALLACAGAASAQAAADSWQASIAAANVPASNPAPALADLLQKRNPTTRPLGYVRRCSHPMPDSLVLVGGAATDTPTVYAAYRDPAGETSFEEIAVPRTADSLRVKVVDVFCGEWSAAPVYFQLQAGPHHLVYDGSVYGLSYRDEDYPNLFGTFPDGSVSQLVWTTQQRFVTRDRALDWYRPLFERAVAARMRAGVSRPVAEAIMQQRPAVGMTSTQLIEAMGEPKRINNYGGMTQYVYGTSRYIYLRGGVVTSIN